MATASRTLVLTIWPDREITVGDEEATYLTDRGLVLTSDGAASNALLAGTPIFRGGTP